MTTGNILPSTGLVFSINTVTCTGGGGAGTLADPYIGATACLLPFGTSIQTKPFSHYVVQAGDFGLPNHQLTDAATIDWNNTCVSDPDQDCSTGRQQNTAGAASQVLLPQSATATQIHNAAHQVVTTVEAGTIVHDFVTVTGQPGQAGPDRQRGVDWFRTAPVRRAAGGELGQRAARGRTGGRARLLVQAAGGGSSGSGRTIWETATYLPSVGECEPLQVVDANIRSRRTASTGSARRIRSRRR